MAGYKKNLTNPYLYKQFSNSISDMYQYTTSKLMDGFYDSAMATSTDGTFKAVCLSGIRTGDNNGSGIDDNDASMEGQFIEIIVRPLTPFGDILPDPRLFSDPVGINDAISIHKTMWIAKSDFGSKDQSSISFGQVVNCYFEDGSIANSDFSGLRFAEPQGEIYNESFKKLATIEGVATGLTAFGNGIASLLGFAPKESSSEDINNLAMRYDAEPSTYKSKNNKKIAQAHPEFQNYIKAFITKCKDSKITISLNSTHRSRSKQNELIAEHAAGTRSIKPAQYSYHLVGLAFDFNPLMPSGNWINSSASKQQWVQSGVPAIGESLGLRWGGNFSTNYDPIHFDLGNKVSINRMKTMIVDAKKKNVEGTQIPTGKKV